MICEEIEDTNDCTYDKDYVPEWFITAVGHLTALSGWEVAYKDFGYYREHVRKSFTHPWVIIDSYGVSILFEHDRYLRIDITARNGVIKCITANESTCYYHVAVEIEPDFFLNFYKPE
jgi:hypothetical protein